MMKIKKDEIIESLNRSGYFLESRVLEVLAEKEYTNFPNQTYPEPVSNKSREIDILSNGPRITEHLKLNQSLQFEYQFQLCIECINNDQPVAFFKRPDKDPYTIFGKFFYAKVEREFKEDYYKEYNAPDFEFNTFTTASKKFHYNQLQKNTQYCSFSQKRGRKEWMASHPDGLHDTFNKLVDYCEHKLTVYEDWIKESYARRNGVYTNLIFPVVVLQNELIEVSEKDGNVEIEKKDHIIFDFNRFSDKKDGFLIDVITEDYLPKYINTVQNGVIALKNSMVELYKNVEIVEIDYSNKKTKE